MEYLKYAIIICILFASSTTASDKCYYEEIFCIRICCDSPEFHKVNVEKCQRTMKYFNISIHDQLQVFNGNHRYMNLLVKFWHDLSVPCLRPEDVIWSWNPKHMDPSHFHPKVIPDYCFAPSSSGNNTKKDPLDCAIESTWYRYSRYVIVAGLIHSVILLLSTIWIYSTINELKENIRLKLFIWYLTSLILAHTSMIAYVYIMWYFFKGMNVVLLIIGFISSYFFMSTFLCMNVIGFEIWITFRELSIEHILSNDRKRFMCYAVYVWGIPPIFYILYFLTLSSFWSFGPVVIILFCNFITFIYLTFKICTTRYNVANLRDDRNPILDTCKILMGLFFMMGVPRIIFFVFLFLGNLAYYMISKYLFLCFESPLIFKLFVLKRNVRNLLKTKYRRLGYLQTNTTTEDISSNVVEVN